MPKTFLTKQQKLNTELCAYISGQMYARHITQTEMAVAIGKSQPAFSGKLKKCNFTFQELTVVFGILQPDGEKLKQLFGG